MRKAYCLFLFAFFLVIGVVIFAHGLLNHDRVSMGLGLLIVGLDIYIRRFKENSFED